jgi:hypothetical protein
LSRGQQVKSRTRLAFSGKLENFFTSTHSRSTNYSISEADPHPITKGRRVKSLINVDTAPENLVEGPSLCHPLRMICLPSGHSIQAQAVQYLIIVFVLFSLPSPHLIRCRMICAAANDKTPTDQLLSMRTPLKPISRLKGRRISIGTIGRRHL